MTELEPLWATGDLVNQALLRTFIQEPGLANPVVPMSVDSWEPVGPLLSGHSGPITAIDCAEFGGRALAVTGSQDATVRVWDMVTGECLEVWPMWGEVSAIACSEEGHVVVASGTDIAVFRLVDR